jgi:type II secretory pathway component GspD/PulD (secretin)
MSRVIRWLTAAALVAALSGCAGVQEKIQPIQGPTFDTLAGSEDEEILPAPEAPPRSSEPIMRIIKGTPVESVEAARRMLAEKPVGPLQGMRTRLNSIILRDVDVRTIAELLTELCGYNVVVTNTVAQRPVNIYLESLTLREAVETICRLNNLWYREGQSIITLMTRQEYVRDIEVRQSDQTRAFYIRYTNAADMAKVIQAAMGEEVHLEVIEDEEIYGHIDPEEEAEVGSGEYDAPQLTTVDRETVTQVSIAQVPAYDEGAGVAGKPSAETASVNGKRPLLAILTVFKRNNCIVARSLDGALLNEMARIIEALDTPTSQVLLEIKILQLTLDDGFESFFDFQWADSKNSMEVLGSKAIGATTFSHLFSDDQINARVAFFENEGRAEIIATPFLMAANNSKVEFFVGEETPLRDDVTTQTVAIGEQGDTLTTFEVNIIREELGTDVEMTTFINEDSTVTLEFDAEISSPILNYSSISVVNEKTGEVIEFPLDAKSTSELKSILSAKSGQSIAIGGIIRESLDFQENKVPLLGDIPGLGFFFREIQNAKKKTETVIILTPHVIMHPAMAGQATAEFLRRKSSHEQITKGQENILGE